MIKLITIDYLIFVHKIPNIFTNTVGVTVMHGISNNFTK